MCDGQRSLLPFWTPSINIAAIFKRKSSYSKVVHHKIPSTDILI